MINHFYAVFNTYSPNTALTNRTLSYLEAWDNMGVKVTAVFMLPDRKYSRSNKYFQNIEIMYIWEMLPFKNYYLHNLLLFLYVYRFIRQLKPGDNVYIMGQSYLLSRISKMVGINIYNERTEHPQAVKSGKGLYRISLDKYLFCCKKLNGMFVISQNLKEYFIYKGVEEKKIHIVNMTVDPSRFDGIKKKEQERKYIAYCGTASNNKDGVDQLIKSFALISAKYPALFLYIIGKAPNKSEKNNNAQLAEQLGVGDRVVFTGVVPRQEMPQLLTDATILALDRPNNLQARHGFPTKLGEYLLTGNPVVVTAVGDIPRFIKNSISGMIAEPENPKDFAAKVEWLLGNPNEAAKIGQKGKEVALANFNSNIEAKKIIDVIFNVK